jgi:hypothetical protein
MFDFERVEALALGHGGCRDGGGFPGSAPRGHWPFILVRVLDGYLIGSVASIRSAEGDGWGAMARCVGSK